MWFLCFVFLGWCKKKKKKFVLDRDHWFVLFFFLFFLIEENAFKYADRKRWSKQPPSIELCRSAWLALLSELCWNSPARSCFLCSLNSHFKSPKCSRIFGRGLFLGGGGRGGRGSPRSSFPVWFNLYASLQLSVDCSAAAIRMSIPASRLGRLLGAQGMSCFDVLFVQESKASSRLMFPTGIANNSDGSRWDW